MAPSLLTLCLFLVGLVHAQTPGSSPEVHPKLQTWKCTKSGGCVKQTSAVVLDVLSHPVHQLENTSLGCGDWGNPPNSTMCPDEKTCAKNCIVEGIKDYSEYARQSVYYFVSQGLKESKVIRKCLESTTIVQEPLTDILSRHSQDTLCSLKPLEKQC